MHHLYINHLWVNGLLQAFDHLGLNSATLTRDLPNFKQGRIRDGCRLDLLDARSLWHRAARATEDPLLGFKAGQLLNPRSYGVLLPIILHSPTLRQSIRHIETFQLLISENGRFHLRTGRGLLECEYVPAHSSVPVHPQQVLSVISSSLLTLKWVEGDSMTPVWMQVPEGVDCHLLSSALGCPVTAHQGNFIFALDESHLDDVIQGRDEYLYETTLAYANTLLRAKVDSQSFLQQVLRCVDTAEPARMTLESVAHSLGIHQRALQRHLADQGTSFRRLKEQILKERVIRLLMLEHQEIGDLVETLGYADASTFHRAFKSWFRMTPKQFRDQSRELGSNQEPGSGQELV